EQQQPARSLPAAHGDRRRRLRQDQRQSASALPRSHCHREHAPCAAGARGSAAAVVRGQHGSAHGNLRGPMSTLTTRPEPLDVAFEKSALVVVDMQNAFASKGGLLDLAGIDISGAARVVRAIESVLRAARARGVQVVYLQTGYKPDLSNGGG